MVQLQHFNRSIPFYMLLNDTRAFVNKVELVVAAMACLEDGRVLCPPIMFTEEDASAAPLLFTAVGTGVFSVTPHNRTDRSAAEHALLPHSSTIA